MSNFAAQLKVEIARIARKEVRGETQTLRKASAHYRADIAALKRRIGILESTVSKLGRVRRRPQAAPVESEQKLLRFRPEGFASLRRKLGLSAADLGKLLGASAQSVYHWESGKTKPRAKQLEAIAAVRKLGKREAEARLAKR